MERSTKRKRFEVLTGRLRYSEDSIDTLPISLTDISLTLLSLEIIGTMTRLNDIMRKVKIGINI